MEAVNGDGPPPPSPLTGCYLLIVLGEPHCAPHKDVILQRLAKGLLSWDVKDCMVDLEKELTVITEQALEGEEAKYGERLIQFASENLVTEILIHPAVNTLIQCIRNLLSSFTRHRHIIHSGYTFASNGSWILQDGTFSLADFAEAFQENDVQRVIHAYENGITMDIHCAPEGDWPKLPKESLTKACRLRINPTDILNSGSSVITAFTNYLAPFLLSTELETTLESSDVVGNIRFSRPTLYVFPGGQGDAALFGINGFNMLLDGGFSRKACFWDFVRHLDRLDAVLVTRLNNSNASGLGAVLQRKVQNAAYPQIGHFFCNIQERKGDMSPDGDKDKDPLLINLIEEGHQMISNLRRLDLHPQMCYRDSEPINLYHKVGHGTLDMYVLSPAKDSREVKDFLQKWNNNDQKLFANQKFSSAFPFPIQNLVSICALLVWRPANPNDTVTRLLFPGSATQSKIFEGLDKIKSLEFIKRPVCTVKSIKAPHVKPKTKESIIEKDLNIEKQRIESKKERVKPSGEKDVIDNGLQNGFSTKIKKTDSTESNKNGTKAATENNKTGPKLKPSKPRSESQPPKAKPKDDIKLPDKKASPIRTLRKVDDAKAKLEIRPKASAKSPTPTPAKSTKDEKNRKVIESKIKTTTKRESTTKALEKKETKVERKPISRRPKELPKPQESPIKRVKKPDTLSRKGKLDKDGTTDSSTVSTPSADQDILPKKDLSRLTPEDVERLKAQELQEEQEAVKELEAVFQKSEEAPSADTDFRKVKGQSIDDASCEKEEYLIIEKEEVPMEANINTDETKKLAKDNEESEKERKLSGPPENIERIKESSEGSPIKNEEGLKRKSDDEVKELQSQPDEKISGTIESNQTTTAPTLPEDEKVPLEEIKEDNVEVIEEKHTKEDTREKDKKHISPASDAKPAKGHSVVGIRLDKQKMHLKDTIKTPDEVADLPMHEEADHFEEIDRQSEEVVEQDKIVTSNKEAKLVDKEIDSNVLELKDVLQPLEEKKDSESKEEKQDSLKGSPEKHQEQEDVPAFKIKTEQIQINLMETAEHAESVVLKSTPESPLVDIPFVDKLELGRKSPKEREEDVAKIVASVAEVLKSEAPLEEFKGKLPYVPPSAFSSELRETHITNINETKIIDNTIETISEETSQDEKGDEPEKKEAEKTGSRERRQSLIKESQELLQSSSNMICDIKEKAESQIEKLDEKVEADAESGTVHRMLVTASSEDGGEEIEICPPGTIVFSKSSESSGRSSPDVQANKISEKLTLESASETLANTVKVTEKKSEKDSEIKQETTDKVEKRESLHEQHVDKIADESISEVKILEHNITSEISKEITSSSKQNNVLVNGFHSETMVNGHDISSEMDETKLSEELTTEKLSEKEIHLQKKNQTKEIFHSEGQQEKPVSTDTKEVIDSRKSSIQHEDLSSKTPSRKSSIATQEMTDSATLTGTPIAEKVFADIHEKEHFETIKASINLQKNENGESSPTKSAVENSSTLLEKSDSKPSSRRHSIADGSSSRKSSLIHERADGKSPETPNELKEANEGSRVSSRKSSIAVISLEKVPTTVAAEAENKHQENIISKQEQETSYELRKSSIAESIESQTASIILKKDEKEVFPSIPEPETSSPTKSATDLKEEKSLSRKSSIALEKENLHSDHGLHESATISPAKSDVKSKDNDTNSRKGSTIEISDKNITTTSLKNDIVDLKTKTAPESHKISLLESDSIMDNEARKSSIELNKNTVVLEKSSPEAVLISLAKSEISHADIAMEKITCDVVDESLTQSVTQARKSIDLDNALPKPTTIPTDLTNNKDGSKIESRKSSITDIQHETEVKEQVSSTKNSLVKTPDLKRASITSEQDQIHLDQTSPEPIVLDENGPSRKESIQSKPDLVSPITQDLESGPEKSSSRKGSTTEASELDKTSKTLEKSDFGKTPPESTENLIKVDEKCPSRKGSTQLDTKLLESVLPSSMKNETTSEEIKSSSRKSSVAEISELRKSSIALEQDHGKISPKHDEHINKTDKELIPLETKSSEPAESEDEKYPSRKSSTCSTSEKRKSITLEKNQIDFEHHEQEVEKKDELRKESIQLDTKQQANDQDEKSTSTKSFTETSEKIQMDKDGASPDIGEDLDTTEVNIPSRKESLHDLKLSEHAPISSTHETKSDEKFSSRKSSICDTSEAEIKKRSITPEQNQIDLDKAHGKPEEQKSDQTRKESVQLDTKVSESVLLSSIKQEDTEEKSVSRKSLTETLELEKASTTLEECQIDKDKASLESGEYLNKFEEKTASRKQSVQETNLLEKNLAEETTELKKSTIALEKREIDAGKILLKADASEIEKDEISTRKKSVVEASKLHEASTTVEQGSIDLTKQISEPSASLIHESIIKSEQSVLLSKETLKDEEKISGAESEHGLPKLEPEEKAELRKASIKSEMLETNAESQKEKTDQQKEEMLSRKSSAVESFELEKSSVLLDNDQVESNKPSLESNASLNESDVKTPSRKGSTQLDLKLTEPHVKSLADQEGGSKEENLSDRKFSMTLDKDTSLVKISSEIKSSSPAQSDVEIKETPKKELPEEKSTAGSAEHSPSKALSNKEEKQSSTEKHESNIASITETDGTILPIIKDVTSSKSSTESTLPNSDSKSPDDGQLPPEATLIEKTASEKDHVDFGKKSPEPIIKSEVDKVEKMSPEKDLIEKETDGSRKESIEFTKDISLAKKSPESEDSLIKSPAKSVTLDDKKKSSEEAHTLTSSVDEINEAIVSSKKGSITESIEITASKPDSSKSPMEPKTPEESSSRKHSVTEKSETPNAAPRKSETPDKSVTSKDILEKETPENELKHDIRRSSIKVLDSEKIKDLTKSFISEELLATSNTMTEAEVKKVDTIESKTEKVKSGKASPEIKILPASRAASFGEEEMTDNEMAQASQESPQKSIGAKIESVLQEERSSVQEQVEPDSSNKKIHDIHSINLQEKLDHDSEVLSEQSSDLKTQSPLKDHEIKATSQASSGQDSSDLNKMENKTPVSTNIPSDVVNLLEEASADIKESIKTQNVNSVDQRNVGYEKDESDSTDNKVKMPLDISHGDIKQCDISHEINKTFTLDVSSPQEKKLSISDVDVTFPDEFKAEELVTRIDSDKTITTEIIKQISSEFIQAESENVAKLVEKIDTSDKEDEHIRDVSTPPIVPLSSKVKEMLDKNMEQPIMHYQGGEKYFESEDEEMPDSPMSFTSQAAHSGSSSHYDYEKATSRMDPMNMSFYGALPDDNIPDPELDFSNVKDDGKSDSPSSYLYEITQAKYGAKSPKPDDNGNGETQKATTNGNTRDDSMTSSFMGDIPVTQASSTATQDKPKDPIESWGKPLGLPSPAPPSNGTPKKERKLPPNVVNKNKLNDDKKRAESPSKYNRNKRIGNPVYIDLAYVPHHGNSNYAYVDFFRRVRARYYVFSGIEPSKEVYDALLEAKQTWEDADLEVTIIPTYDTDVLGYWVAENEELLAKYKIDLSPSASRCTINLQDHETSCSAYRLEF